MTVEVRVRSLSKISKMLDLNFASFAYETFWSIGTKHHENQVMISTVYSAGNVAASCSSSI